MFRINSSKAATQKVCYKYSKKITKLLLQSSYIMSATNMNKSMAAYDNSNDNTTSHPGIIDTTLQSLLECSLEQSRCLGCNSMQLLYIMQQ